MQGICRLCQLNCELQLSHIVPSFVGKWKKKTSATGFMRSADNINRRTQDLIKEYWLCKSCEGLFSIWERDFSLKVFYPFLDEGKSQANYGDWLAKFCSSLTWRTLTFLKMQNPDDEALNERSTLLHNAELALSNFLLGKSNNLEQYEQHLIPLDKIESSGIDLPRNINRYFLRSTHIDICCNSQGTIVYTKLPGFMILGVIQLKNMNKMRSSRVAIGGGRIQPQQYNLPSGLSAYIYESAEKITAAHEGMSELQKRKIEDLLRSNPDKVSQSGTFDALLGDFDLFGREIFRKQ